MADPFEVEAQANAFLAGLKGKGEGEDHFLKVEGVEGDSLDKQHKGEIEVASYGWFAIQMGGGKGGTAGKSERSPLSVQMFSGKASPRFFLACAKREKFAKAELSSRRAGAPADHLKITLTGVKLFSYSQTPVELSADSSVHVMDLVTLTCESVTIEVKEEGADGSLGSPIKAGFQFDEQKPL